MAMISNGENNKKYLLSIVVLVGLLSVTPSLGDADHDAQKTSPQKQLQSECPVMVGKKIDPDIYTVYRGKKVFFCCRTCKVTFEKNPEKYLSRLPQFASPQNSKEHKASDTQSFLAELTVPMGIATLSLVGLTVAMGVLRRRWNPRVMLKIHKTCGVSVLVVGALHAVLVIFLH